MLKSGKSGFGPPAPGPGCELAPSLWVTRFAALVPAGGPVLDLACGAGRHTRFFIVRGHPVTAVDIDLSEVADLAATPGVELIGADLEHGSGWPLGERTFAGVVVTNYLHRPLLPVLVRAVARGGALIYESFAVGNERFGRPRSPLFLLKPGELLEAVRGQLEVVAYECGEVTDPRPAMVQRIAAVRR